MSLHSLANHLQSAGRGQDSVLVHMTPGEVSGLQSLAMAHGGSLTVNPQTGLPEAGFLSSLLPMAIGFGLAPFTGGLSAALITGAGYTAATGSLKKGIMAGLGAYGGAGLASGLNAMGAQAVAPAAPGITPTVSSTASTLGGTSPLANVGAQGFTPTNQIFADVAKTQATPFQFAPVNTAMGPTTFTTGSPVISTTTPPVVKPFGPEDLPDAIRGGQFPARQIAATPTSSISRPFTDYMSQVGQGAKNVYAGGTEGLKALYSAMPKYSVAAGLGGTAATYLDERREKALEEMRNRKAAQDEGLIRPYTFDYGATNVAAEPYSGSAERTHFQSSYTAGTPYKAPGPEYAASGGLTSLAVGGPVEEMAAQNAVGANMSYPMAGLQTPMYSNPTVQRPEATNVIAPSADAGVGSYTGEARFSNGGPAFMGTSGSSSTQEKQGPKFMNTPGSGHIGAGNYNERAKIPEGYVQPAQGPIFMNSVGSGWIGAGNYNERARLPGSKAPRPSWATAPEESSGPAYTYNYDPNTMQFTQGGGGVSGGVAGGTAAAPKQPPAPARPLIPAVDIPAYQTPEQQLGLDSFYDYMNQQMGGYGGYGGYAAGGNVGGISHLGDYSDGGRLLKGPGDGVSDSIPASIGNRQPARLADGEFVIPARIVSEIGNGSTEAGARKLYAMMDRVQKARRKTTGKNQVAANTKAEKLLPA